MAVKKERGKKRKLRSNVPGIDNHQNKNPNAATTAAKTSAGKAVKKTVAKKEQISWLAQYIDHTLLQPAATAEDIVRLCGEAAKYKFFAVCVNPYHVKRAVRELASTEVAVTTVVGFPLGADLTDIKIAQAQRALFEGAEELDMVINIGALKERDTDYVLPKYKR